MQNIQSISTPNTKNKHVSGTYREYRHVWFAGKIDSLTGILYISDRSCNALVGIDLSRIMEKKKTTYPTSPRIIVFIGQSKLITDGFFALIYCSLTSNKPSKITVSISLVLITQMRKKENHQTIQPKRKTIYN